MAWYGWMVLERNIGWRQIIKPIDMFYSAARITPDAVAIDGPDTILRYGELRKQVDALACALQDLDSTPQSRVGICGYNSIEHLIALLATMAAGKVWVPLNPRDSKDELDAKLDAAKPSILILDEDCENKVTPLAPNILYGWGGGAKEIDTVDGKIALYYNRIPIRFNLKSKDTQAIKFTGGSSGKPKGVLQPYRAWVTGAACMIHELGLRSSDRYLLAAPITHGTSCYVTPTLAVGGTLVLGKRTMRPSEIIEAFSEQKVSTTFIPPTVIYMMLAEIGGSASFPHLKRLIYGGAPMPPEKIRETRSVFGDVVATNYGQTEAPQVVTFLSPREMLDEGLVASVGRASFLTRVEIMDPDSKKIMPAGEDGEIVLSGGLTMTGYLDMPEATAEVMHGNWLRTGDLGTLDDRGYLYLKDRLRDVIISGGFNVYPSDIEAALVKHPAVNECVVYGVADEKWGEAVQAAVVLRKGANVGVSELISFAKEAVGSVKAPKRIRILDDLPRSSVGKVVRRLVKEDFLKERPN